MSSEKKEQHILLLSFWAGAACAVVEFIFAIFSHSQSSLMDAAYDGSELIFIALILFLTPLFHRPISERHPYGFLQIESIFLIIKGFMLLAVTVSISAGVIETALSGGNQVNNGQISLFQLVLGLICTLVYLIMKRMDRDLVSPTVDAELLGWKLDVWYSLGMSSAFFASLFLEHTSLSWLSPYIDQVVAVVVVICMLPENLMILKNAIKDVFLFSPDDDTLDTIKALTQPILAERNVEPVFYDVTRTGRHLWVAVYFEIEGNTIDLQALGIVSRRISEVLEAEFENCTCELIPAVPTGRSELAVTEEE